MTQLYSRHFEPRLALGNVAGTIANYLGLSAVESIHVPVPVNFVFVGFDGDGQRGLHLVRRASKPTLCGPGPPARMETETNVKHPRVSSPRAHAPSFPRSPLVRDVGG